MNTPSNESQSQRQHWMSVLARANYQTLKQRWEELNIRPGYQLIRRPEIGLAQVQGRMGGTGRAFNMGDVTITRAVAQLVTGETGYSYLKGRNRKHAELAALIDALLQTGDFQEHLMQQLVQPLHEQYRKRLEQRRSEVASSQVDFFTMVRGEDA